MSKRNHGDIEEPYLSIDELMNAEEELEQKVGAILGASDPKNCSYDKGYVKRQALYSCLTCNPKDCPGAELAGICLACSYNCHDSHDLVELYTKRNFRCDCGNKKFDFSGKKCNLIPVKDDYNELNTYNHNFKGLYCICNREYPEEDETSDTFDDSMIQCVICEDWFHDMHIGSEKLDFDENNADDSGKEMIELVCKDCVMKLEFLKYYKDHIFRGKDDSSNESLENAENEPCDVDQKKNCDSEEGACTPSTNPIQNGNHSEKEEPVPGSSKILISQDAKSICKLKERKQKDVEPFTGGVYWKNRWRESLCRCEECMAMYSQLKVLFLTDKDDCIDKYEAEGSKFLKEAKENSEKELLSKLNKLDHVSKIEAIRGVNEFKQELQNYFKELAEKAENGNIVISTSNIEEFVERLKATKRARMETGFGIPPNSCR